MTDYLNTYFEAHPYAHIVQWVLLAPVLLFTLLMVVGAILQVFGWGLDPTDRPVFNRRKRTYDRSGHLESAATDISGRIS